MLSFRVINSQAARRLMQEEIREAADAKIEKAEKILALQVMKDTDKYVPALTGSLSLRTHIENGNEIVYPGPYARFLYYGKVMIYEPTGSTWAPRYEHKVVTDRDLVMHPTMHAQATSHWFEVSKAVNLGKWLGVVEKELNKDA